MCLSVGVCCWYVCLLVSLSVGVFVCWYVLCGSFVCWCVCLLVHLSVGPFFCQCVCKCVFIFYTCISIRLLSRLALPICLNYLYMINVVQLSHHDESVPTTAFTKVCRGELVLHCIL